MKKILLYYPSNNRSIGFTTQCEYFLKQGHDVYFLTTSPYGLLHADLEKSNVKVFSNVVPSSSLYYLKQFNFLIKFCKKNKIDIVFSHLQACSLVAVFAQYFIKAKVYIFRHHFYYDGLAKDFIQKRNRNEKTGERIVNFFAKKIIVPTLTVYKGLIEHEHVNKNKIQIIPYVYNFELYDKPGEQRVNELKTQYKCNLLLIMCSRLIPHKRHRLVFDVVKELIAEGTDIKLLVLDDGPEKNNLLQYIADEKLGDRFFMVGYTTEVINYMAAADMLVHPSLTEASNSVVKEIGVLKKTVAVCSGVGDFDSYIIDGKNGFLLPPTNTVPALKEVIKLCANNKQLLYEMGNNLREDVLKKFHLNSETFSLYDQLIKN